MHLIVIVQESLPSHKMTGYIGDFIRKISEKVYKAPFVTESWSKIRPREIRIFDFIIPASIEDEVLEDLAPYIGGNIRKLSKIANFPILKNLISNKLGVKPVDMEKYLVKVHAQETRKVQEHPIYISILGKVEDKYTEDGIEML